MIIESGGIGGGGGNSPPQSLIDEWEDEIIEM